MRFGPTVSLSRANYSKWVSALIAVTAVLLITANVGPTRFYVIPLDFELMIHELDAWNKNTKTDLKKFDFFTLPIDFVGDNVVSLASCLFKLFLITNNSKFTTNVRKIGILCRTTYMFRIPS